MITTLILKFLIGLVDRFIPIKKNRYAFFITRNTHWDANLQCMFMYINARPEIECGVIYAHSSGKSGTLNEKPLSSVRGLSYLFTSKVILFDHAAPPGFSARNHIMVNVWHGAPIKGIRFFCPHSFSERYLNSQSKNTSLLIASSKTDKLAMSASFQINPAKVPITGLPRNDLLLHNQNLSHLLPELVKNEKTLEDEKDSKRLILYAPTYRGETECAFNPTSFSHEFQEQLKDILKNNNAILGVRPHKFSPPIQLEVLSKAGLTLDLSSDLISNTSLILSHTDLLITDFSSIWVDFLLTKKPIIGHFPDKSDYLEQRGCIYDFDSIFPGDIALTENDLLTSVQQALHNTFIPNPKYNLSLKMFHAYTDGRSTERVYDEITKLIKCAS